MSRWGKRRGPAIQKMIKEKRRKRKSGDFMDGVHLGFVKARLLMALEALDPLQGDASLKGSHNSTVITIMHTLNRLHEVIGK